ncbi:MAG: polyprenyl synthetase family protein [Armatimonadetes bacterium]|nr:polyprenyl synthetase family protein [Armatimonadota bacterium]MDE2208030.1 polyprenyl synthetase family protein [Armatimonadota bacterium]
MTFDLGSYLTERRTAVEAALELLLPPVDQPPQKLAEAVRYSVLAPGKRLRPILVIAAAECIGGSAEDVMETACALECIHAFSLIHDDLPCMDNDDYRRGRLTNHKVFGEAMALLAGDALLALAFELIAQNSRRTEESRLIPVIGLVARGSGTWGMVGGQVADMEAQGQPVTADRLRRIHERKTGALITASVLAGGLLAGANDAEVDWLTDYGKHVGLAFQIADDILDVTGDETKLGKPVGSDEERDKATYPKVFGLDASRRMASDEAGRAVGSLTGFAEQAEPLRCIARYVVERDL